MKPNFIRWRAPRIGMWGKTVWMMIAWGLVQAAFAQSSITPPAPIGVTELRPAYPKLDNLTPAQASQAMENYALALRQWQNARLAALEGEHSIVVPPRPAYPKLGGLSAQQSQAALKLYEDQLARWAPIYRQASAAEDGLKRKVGIFTSQAEMQRYEAAAVATPADYSWRQDAENSGLTSASIGRLDRDSLAIAGPYFTQSFAVYTRNPQPPFVTSDSLLNGFHVLLEDSVRRFELKRAAQLRELLELAWSSLDARLAKAQVPRAEIEPFARQLAFVIGPALRLLGSAVPLGDSDIEAIVTTEVKKIEAADTVSLPPWLAPADRSLIAIDYRRCRPIGFYAKGPALARYYEATRWLQMIPLRASRDTEVGAAALLADLQSSDGPMIIGNDNATPFEKFIAGTAAIFGDSDGSVVSSAFNGDSLLRDLGQNHWPLNGVIEQFRNSIVRSGKMRPPVVNDQVRISPITTNFSDASLRVLPSVLLPDAVWFEQVNRWRGQPQLPYGNEFAAWMGSETAIADATTREGARFGPFVRAAAKARSTEYHMEETIPDLYYKTLATLFEKSDPAAPAFMDGEAWQRKSLQTALAGWAQLRHTWELQAKFNVNFLGGALRPAGFVEPNPDFFRRMNDLEDFIVGRFVEQGVFDNSEPGTSVQSYRGQRLWQRWQDLERLTHQLEILVQKQLRGADWTQEEAGILKSYGGTLGNIMGYGGDSWEMPLDDAPRWTTVGQDPNIDRNLAVAVGRPRALYVLYPWKGKQILCRGAVMSYYEYPSERRLTDAEWKAELDGAHPPQQPKWIEPLLPVTH